jgi:hypothetical protein
MAQTIQIKRSSSTATPTSLSAGELAYSDSSDKLFIGQPSNNTVVAIGGKHYTNILDNLGAGTGLTFSSNTFSANVDGTNSEAPQNSTTATGRTYKVQVDGSDNLVVNVPWSGGNLSATLGVGNTTGGSNIVFGDSSGTTDDRLVFGAGSDLQIYHNGSNSVIEDAGDGNLKLICQDLEVVDQSDNKLFSSNSSAETIFFAAGSDDAFKIRNSGVEVIGRSLKVNDIVEYTSAHGVEIDGVTVKDGGITLNAGTAVNEFSTDTTLGGNSDDAVPTEKAVKTYVTNATSSFVTSSGVTSVGATAPVTSTGGTTPTIGVTTAAVTNGSSNLSTGDQIYDFVTGGWTSTSSATYHLPFGSKITMGDTDSIGGNKNFEISTTGGSSGSRNVLLQENGGGSITIQGESLFLMHSDGNDAIELTSSGSDTVTVFRSNGSEVARVKSGEFAVQSSAKLTVNDIEEASSGHGVVVDGVTLKDGNVTTTGELEGGSLDINGNADISGNLTLTGNLNITGDVNSTSVTDLDVTDKTITVGVGQTAATSSNSGITVAGANAKIVYEYDTSSSSGKFEMDQGTGSQAAILTAANWGSEYTGTVDGGTF